MNKNHINMKAKLSGKLGFDFIPKEKTRREYEPLTSYNLGLFWGIQAYQVKIQVLKDQESKAPEFRNTSAEVFKMLYGISGTQVSEFRKTRFKLVKTKNNISGTHILEFRCMRSWTTYSPGARLFSPK